MSNSEETWRRRNVRVSAEHRDAMNRASAGLAGASVAEGEVRPSVRSASYRTQSSELEAERDPATELPCSYLVPANLDTRTSPAIPATEPHDDVPRKGWLI